MGFLLYMSRRRRGAGRRGLGWSLCVWVFASSWTLEAAEGVAGRRALDCLRALVDRHLVTVIAVEGDPDARIRYAENIAVFANERLVTT